MPTEWILSTNRRESAKGIDKNEEDISIWSKLHAIRLTGSLFLLVRDQEIPNLFALLEVFRYRGNSIRRSENSLKKSTLD